ncbi:MAG: lipocalin-like domain-containing protein [Thermodesulfobacteriota bacterium]
MNRKPERIMIPWRKRLSLRFPLALLLCLAMLLPACSGSDSYNQVYAPAQETLDNIAAALWMKVYDPAAVPAGIMERLKSPTNSDQAFGQRMSWYLLSLLEEPDSFTPDYSELYGVYLAHTGNLTPHQAYAMANNLGMDSSRGFQEIPPEITFSFPEDDRPQVEYQAGWHFYVGSVFGAGGEEFGVQLMFWRQSLLPPDMARSLGLSDMENQILEIHFAVTPAGGTHYRARPITLAGTTGLVTFSPSPYNYTAGKNYMRSLTAGALFPLELRAWGEDRTGANPVEMEIKIVLDLAPGKGYVLNGDEGLAPSCGGIGTLYYSVTNLPVRPGVSWVKLNGQQVNLVGGKMWYDHQWATGFMPAGNTRSEVLRAAKNLEPKKPDGWDWMAIMFDDDTEIGLSALHVAENSHFYMNTGPNPPGTMVAPAHGVYVDANGSYYPITGTVSVPEWVKSTKTYGEFAASGTWYPNRADVTLDPSPNLPADKRVFSMIPIVATGQAGFFSAGYEYSEGAVYIEQNGVRTGRGFLEAPGYADGWRQSLRIAGLPDTDAMVNLINRSFTPSPELILESQLFVAGHTRELEAEMAACRGL